jgi:2-phospho-L-lactate guanylyltransferase
MWFAQRKRDDVMILGPSRHDVRNDTNILGDHGFGLKAELDLAVHRLDRLGDINRIVIRAADLPFVQRGEIKRLAALDRHRTGTNALSLPLITSHSFRFAYGRGNRAVHAKRRVTPGLDRQRLVPTLNPVPHRQAYHDPIENFDRHFVHQIRGATCQN